MLLCLSFTAGFLYQRQQASAHKVALLREAMFELQQENVIQPSIDGPAPDAEDAPDADLRAEYEAREAAITSELRDLYDLEQEVRQLTGLPPRDAELEPATPFPEEGKGGGPEEAAPSSRGPQTLAVRPAQLIYSTSRPSADLILQEIALRRTSMQSLISDLKVQQDRIERTPSTWPIRLANRHISSRFGYRKDPFTRRLRYHSGTDIGAPTGTPIHATAKGRVVYSGRDSDYGNLVKIDHGDGLQTWYAHMHRRGVTVGDVVQRGQEIGAVGNTGRSTGPHLHYEVRVQGVAVNAEKYLGN
jgi:murein DD-endopeptidase MepM/ murein hydrolase activator NlpD